MAIVPAFVDWRRPKQGRADARPRGTRVLPAIAAAVALSAAVIGFTAAGAGGQSAVKSAAPTPKKSIWGPIEHNGRSLMPTFRKLGIGLYSNTVRWDQVVPTKPTNATDPNDPAYLWPDYLNKSIAAADAAGMEIQILFLGTPPWANGGKSWQTVPTNFMDIGDFATALSKKYPAVDHWMVWGEPNRAPNFQPFTPVNNPTSRTLTAAQQVAPRNYAQILDASYTALKAADPGDNVIGGNTYTSAGRFDDINPYQWIRYLKLPNGQRPRMDMYGHNPFGFDEPDLKSLGEKRAPRGTVPFSDLRFLAREIDRAFPGQRLPLFLAEWGVPTGFKDKDLLYALSAKEAMQWVKSGYRIARNFKRVYTLGWIHPADTKRNSTGLLTRSGKPKPVFKPFQKG